MWHKWCFVVGITHYPLRTSIPRPTLDKLLNGRIDNNSSSDRHLQKILKLLNMTVEDLMLFHSAPVKIDVHAIKLQTNPSNQLSKTKTIDRGTEGAGKGADNKYYEWWQR